MSKKILSLIERESKDHWFDIGGPYGNDDIEKIHDPDGGENDKPRTAIPSPFAQIDLVQEAFKQLGDKEQRTNQKAKQALRIVRNTLDVAELFFNYQKFQDVFDIIAWNSAKHLAELCESECPGQRTLGETLKMFLIQDKDTYNFPDISKGADFTLFFLKNKRNNKHYCGKRYNRNYYF